MIRRIVVSLLQYGLALFAAIVLNFALPRIAPGNPIDFLVPAELAGTLSPEQRDKVLSQFGLDQPLPVQFERYLAGLARGDLAYSVRYGRPVSEILADYPGVTEPDIMACIAYGAEMSRERYVDVPLRHSP